MHCVDLCRNSTRKVGGALFESWGTVLYSITVLLHCTVVVVLYVQKLVWYNRTRVLTVLYITVTGRSAVTSGDAMRTY